MFTKKTILQKTAQVSGATMLSRILGIIREMLTVRYLGATAVGDIFLTAYKIPNSLRKVFAEGALSAAFIPTIVQAGRDDGRAAVNRLITLGFLVFEGILLLLCGLVMMYAEFVLRIIVPGFSEEQILSAVPYLRILMPFILFISSSALLAGALQSIGHFFVPAFGPVLLNVVFIGALLACLKFGLTVEWLCFFILFAGLVQFIMHVIAYKKLGFSFSTTIKSEWPRFWRVLVKFTIALPSVSAEEIGLFVDTSFASYLPAGSIALIYYANRFMGIPLGVFATAFSTILLPHFSRVGTHRPKRLSFYLLESTKFVLWVMIPVGIVMALFSEKIFYTLFLGKKFTIIQVREAGLILNAFLIGLCFSALNKVLRNVYYALHETKLPGIVAIVGTLLNVLLNWLFMTRYHAVGIALATSLAAGVQTVLLFYFLQQHFNFNLYLRNIVRFLLFYMAQLTLCAVPFLGIYFAIQKFLAACSSPIAIWLLQGAGFWLWIAPLCGLLGYVLYRLRHTCRVDVYFLG
jgi:putative peptidoglycan lipid II flippase